MCRIFVFTLLLSLPLSTPAAAPVLLELFTSQGCSSCPPAETLMRALDEEQPAKGFEIIPLVFHVDYWDRLGWKDPWAQPVFTQRQYAYGKVLGTGRVYTPQAIINGKTDKVGHDRGGILGELTPLTSLRLSLRGEELKVEGLLPELPLWIALTQDALSQAVPRGENGGKHLGGHGVVRHFEALSFQGSTARGRIQLGRATNVIAFQQPSLGPVLSAGRLRLLVQPVSEK